MPIYFFHYLSKFVIIKHKIMNELYPEIEKAGDLNSALNIEFEKIGSEFRCEKYEQVNSGNKFATVSTAMHEKLYITTFWRNGVCLVHGSSDNLNVIVQTFDFWLSNNITCKEFENKFPAIVKADKKAEAFDNGTEVAYTWNEILKSEHYIDLHEFIKLAINDELINKLFPFTSHMRLCLSKCTGYPYTLDLPIVAPLKNKQFEVRNNEQRLIGCGNAQEALKILKDNLPHDIQAAISGTADDLN